MVELELNLSSVEQTQFVEKANCTNYTMVFNRPNHSGCGARNLISGSTALVRIDFIPEPNVALLVKQTV